MSTAPPNQSWPNFERQKQKSTPKPVFETPEIRDLERQVAVMDQAQAAGKNAKEDTVVGISSMHFNTGVAETIAITKRGHVWVLPSEGDLNNYPPDWQELPPVPGTKARQWYDARKELTDEIERQKAELGVTSDG